MDRPPEDNTLLVGLEARNHYHHAVFDFPYISQTLLAHVRSHLAPSAIPVFVDPQCALLAGHSPYIFR
jgi:hypothetical protein